MKKGFIFTMILFIGLFSVYGCAGSDDVYYESDYDEGYEDGQEVGYEVGFNEGYSKYENSPENSYSNGYGDGYIDALVENRLLDEAMSYANDIGNEEYYLYALYYAGHTEEAKEYAEEKQLSYPQ
ncbi:MAG: hypothetical protein K0Q87_1710 [Neobacillus sp.]|jgi:hypothetical protein|nr:hypothetical protein [Neobacillus sp.]